MKLHFIAIGGSAMHNLAIALHKRGYQITGSDDEIFEPSKGRLKKYGLLPKNIGWDTSKITTNIDAVILGMHARIDNPELKKAKELGLKIFSYPEYLYEQSKNKKRVVIGGSHGKTTITSMILHVLNYYGINCDYMVGAQLEGFEVMVKLTDDAEIMVIEGDEYLTSPIDRRPKFHLYMPHIALISGIAWDHINVFPTYENYIEQFEIFTNIIKDGGTLIYCKDDKEVEKITRKVKNSIEKIPYSLPDFEVENSITSIIYDDKKYPLQIFGKHNLLNINGARFVCNKLGINSHDFFKAISGFKGASKRLELILKDKTTNIYKDFAHSPSKLKATINAAKEQFSDRKLVACMELHTFSSLNSEFLNLYKNCMDSADIPIVYFNSHTIELKKLPPLSIQKVKESFNNSDLIVYTDSRKLSNDLLKMNMENSNLLLMSSGNFDGIDFKEFAKKILKKKTIE
jgi:UDP-N-acetylmuramate: L-alanyl-gamma-D-glutamyl-meso-diaminopimelate ligase